MKATHWAQRDITTGNGGGAGAAVGLKHVAIDGHLAFSQGRESHTARSERPTRRWIS